MVKVDTINNDLQSNIGQNSMSFTCTSLHVTLLSFCSEPKLYCSFETMAQLYTIAFIHFKDRY